MNRTTCSVIFGAIFNKVFSKTASFRKRGRIFKRIFDENWQSFLNYLENYLSKHKITLGYEQDHLQRYFGAIFNVFRKRLLFENGVEKRILTKIGKVLNYLENYLSKHKITLGYEQDHLQRYFGAIFKTTFFENGFFSKTFRKMGRKANF